jgi:hypothetical protein
MSIFPTIIQNNVQARSLWIGDIEYWMDEGFVINFFQDVGKIYFYLSKCKKFENYT